MAPPSNAATSQGPLTPERVLAGALELADEIGIDAFTIRKLADHLGVKPMTIYHHVPNKEAILDGIVDLVFAEIDLPPEDLDWKAAIRHRTASARRVLARHPWAPPLMESRTSPGMATLQHHDAVLGCLRRGGLSLQTTAHAYAIVDAFLYGFALQEASLPFDDERERGDVDDVAGDIFDEMPEGLFTNLAEFTTDHVLQPGYAFGDSFEFGLDLILDGLAAATERDA